MDRFNLFFWVLYEMNSGLKELNDKCGKTIIEEQSIMEICLYLVKKTTVPSSVKIILLIFYSFMIYPEEGTLVSEMILFILLFFPSFHLDHSGALPWFLTKTSFKGRVFMTHATKAIYRWLVSDYIKVRWVLKGGENVSLTMYI